MNTFNDYMEWAATTAVYPEDKELEYLVNGLTSEAGEVAGKWKKIIRDYDCEVDSERALGMAKELGDVAWYLARLSEAIGWTLQDVIDLNIDKLENRKDCNTIQGEGDER